MEDRNVCLSSWNGKSDSRKCLECYAPERRKRAAFYLKRAAFYLKDVNIAYLLQVYQTYLQNTNTFQHHTCDMQIKSKMLMETSMKHIHRTCTQETIQIINKAILFSYHQATLYSVYTSILFPSKGVSNCCSFINFHK